MIGYRQTLLSVLAHECCPERQSLKNNTILPIHDTDTDNWQTKVQVIAKPWVVLHTDYGINTR